MEAPQLAGYGGHTFRYVSQRFPGVQLSAVTKSVQNRNDALSTSENIGKQQAFGITVVNIYYVL